MRVHKRILVNSCNAKGSNLLQVKYLFATARISSVIEHQSKYICNDFLTLLLLTQRIKDASIAPFKHHLNNFSLACIPFVQQEFSGSDSYHLLLINAPLSSSG